MGDHITSLPTDDTQLPPSESALLNSILKQDDPSIKTFFEDIKLPLVAGALFVFFHSELLTDFIKSSVPYAQSSDTSLVCFKAAVFVMLLYLYIHWS